MVESLSGPRSARESAWNADVGSLIASLGSSDGRARRRARKRLVELGKPAVAALTRSLAGRDELLRREAARTLIDVADGSAAPALVDALEDPSFEVRWLSAQALIALGRSSLIPLLEGLVRHSESVWVRGGAHHVLSALAKGDMASTLTPVVRALEDIEPTLGVPTAADAALDALYRLRRD
ncbi:MAG: HEAT repeat domain-containing protein [Chloroflexi bacterium]|nr:HEAT repeat domain-containing protein [Chloroflexota bacterium]